MKPILILISCFFLLSCSAKFNYEKMVTEMWRIDTCGQWGYRKALMFYMSEYFDRDEIIFKNSSQLVKKFGAPDTIIVRDTQLEYFYVTDGHYGCMYPQGALFASFSFYVDKKSKKIISQQGAMY